MKKVKLILFLIIVSIYSQLVVAQVFVPLTIDRTVKPASGVTLFCDKDFNCGLSKTENEKNGLIDDVISVIVKRVIGGFEFLIDKNLNGNLKDETPIRLLNESEVMIEISRKSKTGKVIKFPFILRHSQDEVKNVIKDRFFWGANYAFVGQLKYKKCSSQIQLADMNRNGFPDASDASRGTNFGIDKNNDKKIWGKDEHHRSNEIIEFCGQNFLVSTLKNTLVKLTPTNLQIAKVGGTVPKFSLTLLNGKTVNAENLSGKTYVFDFWASWCKPCVAELPEIKKFKNEYKDKLTVISINVDESSRKTLAKEIIEKYEMSDFSSIRGLGTSDEFWKTFGGANLNRLSIPLYILIDKNKIIQYSGNGGDNLQNLRDKINEVLTSMQTTQK